MSEEYDYLDGSVGQMFHDFYNNNENGDARCRCPQCGGEFYVDDDARFVECPYCGLSIELV